MTNKFLAVSVLVLWGWTGTASASQESVALRFYSIDGTQHETTVLNEPVLLKVLDDSKLEVFRHSELHLTEGGATLAALEKVLGTKYRSISAGAKKQWVKTYHDAERDIEELLAKASGFSVAELSKSLGGSESDARVLFNPVEPKQPQALVFYSAVCINDTMIRTVYPPFSQSFCGQGKTVDVLSVYALECKPGGSVLRLQPLGAGAVIHNPQGGSQREWSATGKTVRELLAKISKK